MATRKIAFPVVYLFCLFLVLAGAFADGAGVLTIRGFAETSAVGAFALLLQPFVLLRLLFCTWM